MPYYERMAAKRIMKRACLAFLCVSNEGGLWHEFMVDAIGQGPWSPLWLSLVLSQYHVSYTRLLPVILFPIGRLPTPLGDGELNQSF